MENIVIQIVEMGKLIQVKLANPALLIFNSVLLLVEMGSKKLVNLV